MSADWAYLALAELSTRNLPPSSRLLGWDGRRYVVDVCLSRLRCDAQIGPGCLPAGRELRFGLFVGDRRRNDNVLAALPVYRRRYVMHGVHLYCVQRAQNLVEVPPGAHRIGERQLDLFIGSV